MGNKRYVDPIWKILLSRQVHILYFNETTKPKKKKKKTLLDMSVIKTRCRMVTQ